MSRLQWDDIISEEVSRAYRDQVLQMAHSEMASYNKSSRRHFMNWSWGLGLAAAASVVGAIFLRKNPANDDLAIHLEMMTDADLLAEVDLMADLEIIEDLEVLEQWEET